jgi:hypothetical protein
VKNFGFNTPATTDPADPPPDDLDSLTPDNATLSQYGISYWYQVQYSGDGIRFNIRAITWMPAVTNRYAGFGTV